MFCCSSTKALAFDSDISREVKEPDSEFEVTLADREIQARKFDAAIAKADNLFKESMFREAGEIYFKIYKLKEFKDKNLEGKIYQIPVLTSEQFELNQLAIKAFEKQYFNINDKNKPILLNDKPGFKIKLWMEALRQKYVERNAEIIANLLSNSSKGFSFGESDVKSRTYIPLGYKFNCLVKELSHESGIATYEGQPYLQKQWIEDRYILSKISLEFKEDNKKACYISAVFDGHGGRHCSIFMSHNLIEVLAKNLKNVSISANDEIYNALNKTFVELEQMWLLQDKQDCGSTCCFMLVIDNVLWIKNIGDSRAVLINDGLPKQLTQDAKPKNSKFRSEAEDRGGIFLVYDDDATVRLDGRTNMTKALGNFAKVTIKNGITSIIKIPGLSVEGQIMKVDMADYSGDLHIILATDGLWDFVSTEEAAKILNDGLKNKKDLEDISKILVETAYEYGSLDDVTVLVVKPSRDIKV